MKDLTPNPTSVFWTKIPQTGYSVCLGRRAAGGPGDGGTAAAAAVGSAGGRLWRQSLHLSALLSSVSWRDDKCNHQENNIILYYLPRLYQVPLPTLCSAARQRYFQVWNGIFWFENRILFFWKKLVKWQQWHLWQFAHMLWNILNLQILLRYFAVF